MISVLIDYKLDRYTREIKYTFDFMFETLGLSHRFITDTAHLRQHDILLLYGLLEPTLEELKTLTQQYIIIFIPSDPKLYEQGGYTPDQLRRVLREIKLYTQTPVIADRKFDYPAENYTELDIHACKVNFDLAGNIFYHLSNREELCDTTHDHNDCLPDAASAFYNWKDSPYIDNFLWLLDNLIKDQSKAQGQYIVQKHYWPKAQEMAAALTHSVDDLQKWDFNSIIYSVLDDLALFFTLRWQHLFRNFWSKLKYIFTNYEMYWNFQEFLVPEKDQHLRSTWFIAAEHTADIDYALDDADLQDEIKSILRQGNEIGLLSTEDKLIREEYVTRKQIMLSQIRKDQLGIRQFGYILNEKTRDMHQKLYPAYDSSLAFKETAGFKHGMIFPFKPWTVSLKSNHTELPVCFRDKFLKLNRYSFMGLEDAKQMLKKTFQAVRRRRGLFTADFTVASYTDIPYCSKLYKYLLALIKAETSFNATLSEIFDWWEKRNRVTIEESEFDFSLNFPDALESFAIQYFGPHSIVQIEGVEARQDGKNIYFSNLEPNSVAIIRLGKAEPKI
ncbi:MAG: hypothetical protein R6V77_07580 [Candidatus Cloacimonadaceae bacterium]